MAEYIEREAAIEKCREIVACEWNHRASPVSWADAYEQFAEDIEELQSADVAPVRHGRWEVKVGMNFFKERNCPVCKKRIESNFWNYCPNCGCMMDLEG